MTTRRPMTKLTELLQDLQDTLASNLENALDAAHEMQTALLDGEYDTVAEQLQIVIEQLGEAKTLVDLD